MESPSNAGKDSGKAPSMGRERSSLVSTINHIKSAATNAINNYSSSTKKVINKLSNNSNLIANISKNKYFNDRLLYVSIIYNHNDDNDVSSNADLKQIDNAMAEYDRFFKNAYIIYQVLNEQGQSFILPIKMIKRIIDIPGELKPHSVNEFIEQYEEEY